MFHPEKLVGRDTVLDEDVTEDSVGEWSRACDIELLVSSFRVGREGTYDRLP